MVTVLKSGLEWGVGVRVPSSLSPPPSPLNCHPSSRAQCTHPPRLLPTPTNPQEEALAWIDDLRPQKAYLVGMGCGMGSHADANAEIRRRGYRNVELAYDGMLLTDFPFAP